MALQREATRLNLLTLMTMWPLRFPASSTRCSVTSTVLPPSSMRRVFSSPCTSPASRPRPRRLGRRRTTSLEMRSCEKPAHSHHKPSSEAYSTFIGASRGQGSGARSRHVRPLIHNPSHPPAPYMSLISHEMQKLVFHFLCSSYKSQRIILSCSRLRSTGTTKETWPFVLHRSNPSLSDFILNP